MIKLERRFNLLAAIYVGEEMVIVAQRQGNLEAEASAYKNLSRFHGAIGNERLTIVNLEKALWLFEQLGKQSAVIHTKIDLLERSLSYRKIEEVISEMEALLAQATEDKDTANMTNLHLRLLFQTQTAGLYDKMETHVGVLEKIPLSDPIKPMEYGKAIHAALGRADLLKVRGKLAEAERFYQKTLRLCEAQPSRWLEIQVLHSLSDLEWERGNVAMAKSYLDKAHGKAGKLELDDLLAVNYESKAKIAEAEQRFGDALAYIKKQQFHKDKFKSQSAGFNPQSYFLQKEKDQLATDKKNQALELQLKEAQLRNALIITAFVLLLATGFLFGMNKQRKAKQELAAQNVLIQQQSEKLKTLDVAKSHFFANVSHELRTPLTLLLGPIKTLLKENQLTEKQSQLLQMANHSGKQLQQLVNEILDLQKLEMGKMELYEKPTQLSLFFNRYAAQFESLAQRRQIDFSIETTVGDEVMANIDQEKCRQIIYNLLSNAFKFTPPGGRVKVKLEIRNWEIEETGKPISKFQISNFQISVSDSGPGIHPDDLPHVFDRFFQTTRPEKPAEGGTGIGLALCHEYAHLFGGKIEVESPDPRSGGKGTIMRVTFPIKVLDSPKSAVHRPQPDEVGRQPWTTRLHPPGFGGKIPCRHCGKRPSCAGNFSG
jgi:signal transduction histidine kinase